MKSIFNKDNYRVDYLMSEIEKYDVISFDVFDTLMKRNVKQPSDIFRLLNIEVESRYKIKDFYNIRKNIEYSLEKVFSTTIYDIYAEIKKIYPSIDVEEIIKKELELEKSYCQANYQIKKIFDYAKSLNKRILAISDMYLSKEFISSLLIKCGYDMRNVHIYVSNEYNAKKKSGELFEIVCDIEKINKKDFVHIGDSYKSDFFGAWKAGTKSKKIPQKTEFFNTKSFYNKIIQKDIYDIHKSIINNNICNMNSFYQKLGFAVIGPALFSFCKWIENDCIKNGIDKIYFFSREGYVFKEAFDLLNNKKIETHYLCVSRRSLRVPYNAIKCEYDDVIKMFPITKLIDVKTVFKYLDLDSNDYTKILNELGMKESDILMRKDFFNKNSKIYRLVIYLLPDYISKSKRELSLIKEYFKQEKVNGKFAVVDIGWKKSLQFCIKSILDKENISNEIYGYYFGLQDGGYDLENTRGFIRDSFNSEYANSVNSFIGLIESFFLEQNGTVLNYYKENDEIKVFRDNYEYENGIEKKAYAEIQKGMIEYIKIVSNFVDNHSLVLNGHDAYIPIKEFGTNPYYKDVNFFLNFRYLSEKITYLFYSKPRIHYLLNLKGLKKDLYNSRWKIGFLKRLFIFKLPYYKIYVLGKGKEKS